MRRTGTSLAWAAGLEYNGAADAIRIVLASLAIGILAQIAVPVGPVPVTGQTLGVLAVAVALGSRRGSLAVLAYLAQGAAGLPVFAGGTAGFAVLLGPSAGYLVAFVPAAFIVGYLCERMVKRTVIGLSTVLVLGTVVIYLVGASWLSRFVGAQRSFALGVAPFVFGDALKIAIIAFATAARPRDRR